MIENHKINSGEILFFLKEIKKNLQLLPKIFSYPIVLLKKSSIDKTEGNFVKPFPKVKNPIITKEIVTDRKYVQGVADPFIVRDKGRYHMFFEVIGGKSPTTGQVADEIGHAYSDNLFHWTYTQIVLSKEQHSHRSAYPHVFKVDGIWYMVPDIAGEVVLYQAKNFPLEWELVGTLLSHETFHVDTNIFQMGDVWYLTTTGGQLGNNGVSLYYNTSGDWKNNQWNLHPVGLLIPNDEVEGGKRGAGNPSVYEDYVLLPIQITPTATGQYGEYTKLYKLTNLSTSTAEVTDLGKLIGAQKDGKWNHRAMHHCSHAEYEDRKIYVVDGVGYFNSFSIGLFIDK